MYYFKRNLLLYVLFALLGIVSIVQPKHFTRCGLTKELIKQGFSRTFISNWVCLVEHESGRNTTTVVKKSNGSYNYGIFQINSKAWCKIGNRKGGFCNISCEALLDDDITDDCICANRIFDKEGFKWWSGWMKRCKGCRLPDVEKCPDYSSYSRQGTPEKDTQRQYHHSISSNSG